MNIKTITYGFELQVTERQLEALWFACGKCDDHSDLERIARGLRSGMEDAMAAKPDSPRAPRVRPYKCIRCGDKLTSEVAIETGICAGCWTPADNRDGEQL